MKTLGILLSLVSMAFLSADGAFASSERPKDFVSLQELDSSIIVDLKYLTDENFVGRPIKGYKKNTCYLVRPAAEGLVRAQKQLNKSSLSLKIFDCYRPQRAVDDFVQWSKDLKDQKMKAEFYPKVEKKNLFKQGYIASRSGHSRGSTVDLTLVDLKTKQEIDMGSIFDFFDPISHTDHAGLTELQKKNRQTLKAALEKEGFKNYSKEWWHYSMPNETYPKTHFDFEVE